VYLREDLVFLFLAGDDAPQCDPAVLRNHLDVLRVAGDASRRPRGSANRPASRPDPTRSQTDPWSDCLSAPISLVPVVLSAAWASCPRVHASDRAMSRQKCDDLQVDFSSWGVRRLLRSAHADRQRQFPISLSPRGVLATCRIVAGTCEVRTCPDGGSNLLRRPRVDPPIHRR
jgi:hypothetical protein